MEHKINLSVNNKMKHIIDTLCERHNWNLNMFMRTAIALAKTTSDADVFGLRCALIDKDENINSILAGLFDNKDNDCGDFLRKKIKTTLDPKKEVE